MIETALLEEAHFDDTQRELLKLTWELLHAIHTGDIAFYAKHSTADLSCFEDVCAYRIDGVDFHLSLMRQMAENPDMAPRRFDIVSPRVQVYGDTAIVTYTRLMTFDSHGTPVWKTYNETRVYIQREGVWKMAHFHRSPTS